MEPIKIGILNLMQNKLDTMRNFQIALGDKVETKFYYSATRYVDRQLDSSITDNMEPLNLDEIKDLDGFIITGSPVEKLDFPQVSYFDEINDLIDLLDQLNIPQLYVCWGAMAALNRLYDIDKKILPHKTFGVFQNQILTDTPLLNNIGDNFPAPHARNAEMDHQQLMENPDLVIDAVSENGLLTLVESIKKHQTFIFSHLEYQKDGLDDELKREQGSPKIKHPMPATGYYSPLDQKPVFSWKQTQQNFYNNWVQTVAEHKLTTC
ncbi:homoserine O-acetyltransferase/O-succinyltransferase family protein [Companilactobacillus farciminis]|uniref:homoserine O-acetyltransferase/O-succinyltransferase family protein n=1 Tax=Companilactobacillus farciminis TaxID=1612 RepID=UPI00232EA338|nr:homoserine O-succinyltransferase [Companilactobacillus farciminis]WCG36143.1 homoserine O-succinyltransferase [Companilactobacillus farciminis]